MIWKLCYFFPVFSQILGKTLNLIWVWEFPEYLWLSLPSGPCRVMSYLMQSDKQYACTDSIKEAERGTHAHTDISTFWQAVSLTVHILLHCLLKSHPLQLTPALQPDLACGALKNSSRQTSVFPQKPH